MRNSESGKLRYAVIGRNFVADWMIAAARQLPEFTLTAVYSRREETASAYAEKHGAGRWYTDLDALARDPEIDMVYIASPNAFHEAQTIKMLEAGKHVLCEKPIAPSYEALVRMRTAADRAGRVLMEAMVPVHTSAAAQLRAWLGEIAPVRRVSFCYCQYSSRYDAYKRGVIENAFDPTLCNGALMDIGIYPIHLACCLFGRPEVIAASGTFLPGSIDGEGTVLLRFPGGLSGDIRYAKITDSVVPSEIMGEDGNILIDSMSRPRELTLYRRGGGQEVWHADTEIPDMTYELRDFAAQVRGGVPDPFWLDRSEDALRTADAVRAAVGIDFCREK